MQRSSAQSHPMQSMGAIDAYGGSLGLQHGYAPQRRSAEDEPPRNASTPRRRPTSPTPVPGPVVPPTPADESFERDSSCGASIYSETDTDDEPTIRPSNSCANSETQSLYSNDGANEDEDLPVTEEDIARRLLLSRPTHRRWDSSSSSIDGEDARMASP